MGLRPTAFCQFLSWISLTVALVPVVKQTFVSRDMVLFGSLGVDAGRLGAGVAHHVLGEGQVARVSQEAGGEPVPEGMGGKVKALQDAGIIGQVGDQTFDGQAAQGEAAVIAGAPVVAAEEGKVGRFGGHPLVVAGFQVSGQRAPRLV